jgi:DNA-binding NtrC family response regulator
MSGQEHSQPWRRVTPSLLRHHRVLVVGGEVKLRDTVCHTLARAGYPVALAPARRDVLWRFRSPPPLPEVVLLDFLTPEMSGYEFREQQKQHSSWADIPVIVLPGDRDTEAEARAIGALGALRRPLDVDQLLAFVARGCSLQSVQPDPPQLAWGG